MDKPKPNYIYLAGGIALFIEGVNLFYGDKASWLVYCAFLVIGSALILYEVSAGAFSFIPRLWNIFKKPEPQLPPDETWKEQVKLEAERAAAVHEAERQRRYDEDRAQEALKIQFAKSLAAQRQAERQNLALTVHSASALAQAESALSDMTAETMRMLNAAGKPRPAPVVPIHMPPFFFWPHEQGDKHRALCPRCWQADRKAVYLQWTPEKLGAIKERFHCPVCNQDVYPETIRRGF